MIYRPLGSTGLKVSQLGFGAMRLPMTGQGESSEKARVNDELAVPLIRRAFERGVNYIDSAVFYCNHDSQRAVGEALAGRRDKIVVATKNSYKDRDERLWRKNLDDSLRFLRVETIDVYNIHGLSWQVWQDIGESHLGPWLLKARDEGLIRHIACSSHDNNENVRKLMDLGLFESFTLQYNMLDRALEDAIAHAGRKGIGISVMGPLAGGRLGAPNEVFDSVIPGIERVAELALRFVLANPAVSVAMSGMTSFEEIDRNSAVAGDATPLSPADYAAIDEHLKRLKTAADLYCTGCNYCSPCPQNVRIARIFRTLNLGKVYGLWPRARKEYAGMLHDQWDPEAKQADSCAECGQCEPKCPQNIPIREQLKEAHKALAELPKK